MTPISVVIIAKDAEQTIDETLKSLQPFDEVLVYLNDSSDGTQQIAETYPNCKVVEGTFEGFGPTKNSAASLARNNWILSLDSDEVVLPELLDEIAQLKLDDAKVVFRIKRDNYFLGKHVKHSGWGNDRLVRIYNRQIHRFTDSAVHEKIELANGTITKPLIHSFKHNAVQDINQFLYKVIKYSDLAAKDKKTCSFLTVLAKAHFAFFKTYFLQLGFLDGWRGFVIAVSNFNGKFFRYTKRYINCKKK
jgi:glycosyltransferase involved in cell wall biosynthesis